MTTPKEIFCIFSFVKAHILSPHQMFHSLTLLQVLTPQVLVEKSSDFGGVQVSMEALTLKRFWIQMMISVNARVSVT